jgi:hypothetical protein
MLIFFIDKLGEKNFISENALISELGVNSFNDDLILKETKKIQSDLLRENVNVHEYLQKYFKKYLIDFKKQQFAKDGNFK